MAEPSRGRLQIRQLKGLVTIGGHALEPGQMQVLQNVQLLYRGRAEVRKGIRPVGFDNAVSSTPADIIAMSAYQRPEAGYIVYEDSNGNVKLGRNPS